MTEVKDFPSFNSVSILDEVLIMGYPPIPCTGDAYLLTQKGEVNSIVYDYLNKVENIVVSSITRPGNSGGPVISRGGYLVGMVTHFTEIKTSTDKKEEATDFPFYMAMSGKELYNGIKEIDSDLAICYEDYQ